MMLKLTTLIINHAQIAYRRPILNLQEAMCSELHTPVRDYANFGQPKCPKAYCHKMEKLNTFDLAGLTYKNFNDKNKSGLSRLSHYQISCSRQNEAYIHIGRLGAIEMARGQKKAINLDIFCGVARCLNYLPACLQIRRHKNLTKEVAPLRRIMEPLVRVA